MPLRRTTQLLPPLPLRLKLQQLMQPRRPPRPRWTPIQSWTLKGMGRGAAARGLRHEAETVGKVWKFK